MSSRCFPAALRALVVVYLPTLFRRSRAAALFGLATMAGMSPVQAGALESPAQFHALTHARLVIRPGEVVEQGTVLLRDGVIVAAGVGVAIPAGARVLDLQGRTVFAGFIDVYSAHGQVPGLEAAARPEPPLSGLAHPSTQIHAHERVADRLRPEPQASAALRSLGFTSVASQPRQGIFRGQAAVLTTGDGGGLGEVLVTAEVAQALAFDQNPKNSERYPVFTGGATSLIRQTLLDARWYQAHAAWQARGRKAASLPERPDLLALQPALARRQPVFIEARNEFEFDRAWRVGAEFDLDWVVAGNGYEYRYADALKAQGARVVVPLIWPQAPRVQDEDVAREVSLAELEHWEWAPYNARVLAEAGVPFAFTATGLEDPGRQFWARIRRAVALGLDEQAAIAALTEVPARLLGLQAQLGSLQPGRRAHLVVADADLFRSSEARIHEVWVEGQRYFTGDGASAGRVTPLVAASRPALPGVLRFPGGEFGRTGVPAQPAAVLLQGATVWTQGAQGTQAHADVLVERGRIRAIGRNLKVPAGATRIDATGLHLTPGLIDTHSHIAINRGNDYGESSDHITGEVGNADILKPTDIAIYHHLADGVTSVLLLQGSGNPINGQSQAIKLRWGADAEGLKIAGAPPSMKLALGENAKQSNWGRGERYPLTRMGVHESVREAFEDARAYVARQADKSRAPQRRDLRLEAVAEILSGRSTMHVHSYRQSEVLAFLRLSAEYGVKPVFHHISEGYKVADEMAELGAGASAFVDYWGMKWETDEATTYNAAMMMQRGVLVSLSSDSTGPSAAASGPRLNLDASYTVRFGGLSPQEALGLVTLNAARQMGLGDRIGSLEPGKDADFVLWSDDPLSPRAIVQQTWIDGRRYFDREEDRQERARIVAERERLIARIRQSSGEDAR